MTITVDAETFDRVNYAKPEDGKVKTLVYHYGAPEVREHKNVLDALDYLLWGEDAGDHSSFMISCGQHVWVRGELLYRAIWWRDGRRK